MLEQPTWRLCCIRMGKWLALFHFDKWQYINPLLKGPVPVFNVSEAVNTERNQGASEIDPEKLWTTIRKSVKKAMDFAAENRFEVKNIGISTQRSTCTLWEAKSGKVLHNFVTWQDLRGTAKVKSVMQSFSFKSVQKASALLYKMTGNKKYLAGAVIDFRVSNSVAYKPFHQIQFSLACQL